MLVLSGDGTDRINGWPYKDWRLIKTILYIFSCLLKMFLLVLFWWDWKCTYVWDDKQRSFTCCSRLWGQIWSSFWAVLKCSCLDFLKAVTDTVTPPDLPSWNGLHALLAVFKDDAELWRQLCLHKAEKCFQNIQIPLFLTAFLFFLIFCCFAA